MASEEYVEKSNSHTNEYNVFCYMYIWHILGSEQKKNEKWKLEKKNKYNS